MSNAEVCDFEEAIATAEELRDPLEGLIERCAVDPGEAFEEEVVEELIELRRAERAKFETLRARLKKAGVRITALEQVMAESDDAPKARDPSPAEILAELANEATLFHHKDGKSYADVMVNGHRETWPVFSRGFRRWLAREYFNAIGGAASSEATQSALNLIDARAQIEGPELEVAVRVASDEGRIYLDLCDEQWRAIEIDQDGWRVIEAPPVRFRRSSGMRALPMPEPGGSIDALRAFVNVKTEHDFVLAVAWALGALSPEGPYPVLAVAGEQGSAKSTFCGLLRSILDPNASPLRSLPREDRDLFIAAQNARLLAFDNVSGLPAWMSDTLCRLATGGGFSTRELYTNGEEAIFEATRPMILNGIEDFVTRPDLGERSVFLNLESIPEAKRRPESELWAAFNAERGSILGALLDGVSEGLRRRETVELDLLPRMADFARWASACETAFWPMGTFLEAYTANREESVSRVIEGDAVASAIRALVDDRTIWTGSCTDLLAALKEYMDEDTARAKNCPKTPNALSNHITRIKPALRKSGIEVTNKRAANKNRTRLISVFRQGSDKGEVSSTSSTPSAPWLNDLADDLDDDFRAAEAARKSIAAILANKSEAQHG